jgi:acyl-CoA thioesterase-2
VPIEYQVIQDRDGRSFSARRVEAWQEGQLLVTLSASFHDDEPGLEHQFAKPDVPEPEALESLRTVIDPVVERFPESLQEFWKCDMGIEFRAVEPFMPFTGEPRPPVRHFWMRANNVSASASRAMHRAVLAYASDMHILDTGLLPLGAGWAEPTGGDASLDHALWFHGDFRVDDWLLYAMDSPRACGNRFLGRGLIYTRDGTLVASVTQEGLIRLRVQRGDARP